MRNLYASTLKYSVLGLFLVQPMYAYAVTCPPGVTPASNGRLLAAQCAQCHGSGGNEDLGSYVPATGTEGPQAMQWQLQGYSDAERCAIANYYATGFNIVGGGTPPPPASALHAQTLSFGAAPSITAGQTGTLSATATSGLTPAYKSLTTSTCTIKGSTVTGVAAGSCTIAANQAGNASYKAAPQVTQTITIGAAVLRPKDD